MPDESDPMNSQELRSIQASFKLLGDLDFRGTLGVMKAVPVGFQNGGVWRPIPRR